MPWTDAMGTAECHVHMSLSRPCDINDEKIKMSLVTLSRFIHFKSLGYFEIVGQRTTTAHRSGSDAALAALRIFFFSILCVLQKFFISLHEETENVKHPMERLLDILSNPDNRRIWILNRKDSTTARPSTMD